MLNIRNIALSYLIILLLVSVIPLGSMNSTLNDNYTLSIRWDYLLHGIVYFPLPVLLSLSFHRGSLDIQRQMKRTSWIWTRVIPISMVVVVLFESVQKLLPYRAFNINDMLANGIGAILGLLFFWFFRKFLVRLGT